MKTPSNQEHLEAAQSSTNKDRSDFLSTLSESDKAKFLAVEQAVQILVDHKILFYLFPYLPTRHGVDGCWQWNSLLALAEFDNAGLTTKDSVKQLNEFGCSFAARTFNTILDSLLRGGSKVPHDKQFEVFINFVNFSLGVEYARSNAGSKPPSASE